jgi:hypothetical protein
MTRTFMTVPVSAKDAERMRDENSSANALTPSHVICAPASKLIGGNVQKGRRL